MHMLIENITSLLSLNLETKLSLIRIIIQYHFYPCLLKYYERIVHSKVISHILKCKLISNRKFGFRPILPLEIGIIYCNQILRLQQCYF